MTEGIKPESLLPEEVDGILRGEEKGGYKHIVVCPSGARLLYKKKPSKKELSRVGAVKSEKIKVLHRMPTEIKKGTKMEDIIMNMRRLYLLAGEEMNKAFRRASRW